MLALRDLQRGFWESLRTGEADAELAAVVLPTSTLAPEARIRIYAEMYLARLVDVLGEDFPRTAAVLGEGFAPLCRRYLACHPSEDPSVRHVGTRFAAFLATEPALEPPWLAELARLERARVDVFDAPDLVPIRLTDLAAVAPEAWGELRFTPVPALEVVRSAWPVQRAWAAGEPIALDPEPTALRVWRQDFKVFHAPLDPLEGAALDALCAGEPFGAICEAVAEHATPEEAPAQAGALLRRWLEDGLIAAIAR
jgi:hypothetical protein